MARGRGRSLRLKEQQSLELQFFLSLVEQFGE